MVLVLILMMSLSLHAVLAWCCFGPGILLMLRGINSAGYYEAFHGNVRTTCTTVDYAHTFARFKNSAKKKNNKHIKATQENEKEQRHHTATSYKYIMQPPPFC